MNNITFIGNLTKDPVQKATPNGKEVCNFWVAVDRKFNNEAQYIKVTTWGTLAENCGKFLAKGSKVAVYGEPAPEHYTKDGQIYPYIMCNADLVEFLSRPKTDEVKEAAENAMASDIADIKPSEFPF